MLFMFVHWSPCEYIIVGVRMRDFDRRAEKSSGKFLNYLDIQRVIRYKKVQIRRVITPGYQITQQLSSLNTENIPIETF